MENKNSNNKLVVVLLVVIIVILSVLCVLFATGTVTFKSNSVDNENVTENNNNENSSSNNNNENSSSNNNEGNNVLSHTEAKTILASLDEKYYDYYVDAGVYCGASDLEDIIYPFAGEESWRSYKASKEFKNVKELKTYLESIMVKELIPNYLDDKTAYIEKNGKLYCEIPHKGGWIHRFFDKETEYSIKNIQENKIDAQITFSGLEIGYDKPKNYNIDVTITKSSSGNWLVSSYEIQK